ncbi:MAG TPA: type II toxin-antitoxin system mRNA interferase toxin, RelE/StbE family [Candidatus Paceibacterota bacterium]
MIVIYSKKFRRNYKKLPFKLQEQFKQRRRLFLANPFDLILNNHALHDPYVGCRSINITGDYRAIFYQENESVIHFLIIGTHHELFGT